MKLAGNESRCHDKITMSRHHKRATKTFKEIDWCRDNMKNKFQDAKLQVDDRCRDMDTVATRKLKSQREQ